MRKLFFALAAMLFMTGLVIATEVTVVSYDKDKKEVKVKEGDAEKTYKISDKVKVSFTNKDKDGNEKTTDGTLEALEKRLSFVKADSKFPTKMDVTVADGTITEVKMRGGFQRKKKE